MPVFENIPDEHVASVHLSLDEFAELRKKAVSAPQWLNDASVPSCSQLWHMNEDYGIRWSWDGITFSHETVRLVKSVEDTAKDMSRRLAWSSGGKVTLLVSELKVLLSAIFDRIKE